MKKNKRKSPALRTHYANLSLLLCSLSFLSPDKMICVCCKHYAMHIAAVVARQLVLYFIVL